MAYDGPNRRDKSSERRATKAGAPPPGTVIDRRLGLDQRQENDPRQATTKANGKASNKSGNKADNKAQGSTKKTASTKSRKKSLVPSAGSSPKPGSSDDGFTGLERKRGRGRRLSEFTKSAEEGEMTTEQFLFLMAIDAFKKGNDRMFPTWTDVLEVIRLLGYRKTMPTELNLTNAEDWLERSDSPANVRPDRWAERFTESSPAASSKKSGPKTEEELTDEALEAFEVAFGDGDDGLYEAEELIEGEIDTDFDTDADDYSEAA